MLLTLCDERVALSVASEVVAVHGSAEVQEGEHVRQHARVTLVRHLRVIRVEVWHALPADTPRQHVLVRVDQREDTPLSQLVYQLLYSIQVRVVVFSGSILDGFPHYTKPHEVETPVSQLVNL